MDRGVKRENVSQSHCITHSKTLIGRIMIPDPISIE